MFQFEGFPSLVLIVQPRQHQRRIINRDELIRHHRQDAGYKKKQKDIPASDQNPFYNRHIRNRLLPANVRILSNLDYFIVSVYGD